jgi:hypothetical protein
MKPIIIVPPGMVSKDDMAKLESNGICIIEAADPSKVKFLDPIPSAAERTKSEDAAIMLSRKILSDGFWKDGSTRKEMATAFVDILVKGTRLDPRGTLQEQEQRIIDDAKRLELQVIGREEARAERAAKKAKPQSAQEEKK